MQGLRQRKEDLPSELCSRFSTERLRITSILEYGEGVEGIDMYDEVTDLINIVLADYEAILEQDKEKNKAE